MTRLAVAAVFALSAAPARAEDDPKKVLEALQGDWKVVSFSKGGRVDEAEAGENKLVVAGDKMTFVKGGEEKESPTFKLNPKATPAAIDMVVKEGGKDFTVKGIYKLDKDALTLCFGLDAGDRPKEFKPGENIGLMVLERAKK